MSSPGYESSDGESEGSQEEAAYDSSEGEEEGGSDASDEDGAPQATSITAEHVIKCVGVLVGIVTGRRR